MYVGTYVHFLMLITTIQQIIISLNLGNDVI